MKCLRIYATPDGESRFGEIDIPTEKVPVHPEATPFDVSASYPASRIRFTHIPPGMRQVDWHTVPDRVLTVRLNDSVEYETSDGETRKVQHASVQLNASLSGSINGKNTLLYIPAEGCFLL